jgi:hypothetical protein
MSDNYKPPFHSISIASQLLTIWNLYRCFPLILDKVPSSFYAKIDYAAMCLIKTSLEKSYEIETSGFHSDRTLKSAEKRKAKKEQDKQPVLEAYYKVPNRDSIPSLNALVQSILELLKTSMQTPPSNKTVVRYLEDEGLADKHKRNI